MQESYSFTVCDENSTEKKMDKNEEISLAIGKIINAYGRNFLAPNSGIKGLLMDLIPRYENERRLLLTALSCGVGEELNKSQEENGGVSERAKNSSRRLLLNSYVSEEAADMAIQWIVNSFDITESLPKPKKYKDEDNARIQDFELSIRDIGSIGTRHERSGQYFGKSQNSITDMRELANRFLSKSARLKSNHSTSNLGVKYDPSGQKMIRGALESDNYAFDDNVTVIGEKAFAGAKKLVGVTFTNNIIALEKEAFANCSALTNIVLLRTLKNIGEGVFKGCTALTTANLPSNIEKIPRAMFKKCSSLSNINLPRSLQIIGDEAFRDCRALSSIEMPENVSIIGNRAFIGCINLQKILLGKNIKEIGRDAFIGCSPDFCIDVVDNMYVMQYCILNNIKFNRIHMYR